MESKVYEALSLAVELSPNGMRATITTIGKERAVIHLSRHALMLLHRQIEGRLTDTAKLAVMDRAIG